MNRSVRLLQNLTRVVSMRKYTQILEGEQTLITLLKKKFPKATDIRVNDISGGCGAMYDVTVESQDFEGMRKLEQHRLIQSALEGEIKNMHGLVISARVPKG